MNLPSLICP